MTDIEITQADRKAAWRHRPWFMTDTVATVRAWNAGEYDHLDIVQAFARHRIDALEEAAKVAEERFALMAGTIDQHREREHHGRSIATAIRNLPTQDVIHNSSERSA